MCGAVVLLGGFSTTYDFVCYLCEKILISLRSFVNVEKHCVNVTFAFTNLQVDLFQVLPLVNGKS